MNAADLLAARTATFAVSSGLALCSPEWADVTDPTRVAFAALGLDGETDVRRAETHIHTMATRIELWDDSRASAERWAADARIRGFQAEIVDAKRNVGEPRPLDVLVIHVW
jgi:hypothetical protein